MHRLLNSTRFLLVNITFLINDVFLQGWQGMDYTAKLLDFKVSARKGTADPIHLKATELITLFSL